MLSTIKKKLFSINAGASTPALPYKVYSALLTQSGGDDTQTINSGDLIIGVTYKINSGNNDGDFTNVGAPNNNPGTYFVATGTVPNSWGIYGELKYNTGAPVTTVLENTIGNIWFTYGNTGAYLVNSDGLFIENKSLVIVGNPTWNGGNGFIQSGFDGTNTCIIATNQNFLSGPSDCELLEKTPIEIRVYN